MKIELRRLVDIFPYKQNARKIPQRAIDKVALSLKEFGWQQPIVIDKHGVIVVGHTRWLAAQQLAWLEAPVTIFQGLAAQQLGWTVAPVHVADKARLLLNFTILPNDQY